jgi:hypothetical protein
MIMIIILSAPIIQYNQPSDENIHLFQFHAEKWWELMMSIPAEHNPLTDKTGEWTERVNQHTGVYYLAAGVNQTEPFVRNVTIEYGRPIFFPILVGGYAEIPIWPITQILDFRNCITKNICNLYQKLLAANHIDLIDVTKDMHFTIDGKNMPYQRITTAPYNVNYNLENPYNIPGGSHVTVVDGYWAYIDNLAVGNHTIIFGGHSPPDYFTTTIYKVEVK